LLRSRVSFVLPFFLSLLLHAFLFVWIASKFTAPPQTEQVQYVDVTTAPLAPVGDGKPARKSRGGGAKKEPPPSTLKLSDLGIGWTRSQEGTNLPLGIEPQSGEGTTDEAGDGSGEGTILGVMKNTSRFEILYNRIDEGLYYPEEFVDAGIEGNVTVQLSLAPDGTYQKRFSKVDSSSNFLRVFVLRILKKTLNEPLPSTFAQAGRNTRLRLLFQFEATRKENAMDASGKALDGSTKLGVRGDHLAFYRAGRLVGQWKLGPVGGYGPGIGLDAGWLWDKVSELGSKKADIDPLDTYRQDPDW
jgi:hypothetical protein